MHEGSGIHSADGGGSRRRWLLPLALLLTIWAVALSHYPRMPRIVPGYFQLGGDPAVWVPKGMNFFGLPLLAGVVYFAMSALSHLASRNPSLMGQALRGAAATNVAIMLRRFLWFMNCAILVFLLNVQFRSLQIAYGSREDLGWDSYLLGGMVLGYTACGSIVLYRYARRWLRWQAENDGSSESSQSMK